MNKFDSQKHINSILEFGRFNDCSLIEAVLQYCEREGLEVEYIASIIKKEVALKAAIQSEAHNLHMLKANTELPFE